VYTVRDYERVVKDEDGHPVKEMVKLEDTPLHKLVPQWVKAGLVELGSDNAAVPVGRVAGAGEVKDKAAGKQSGAATLPALLLVLLFVVTMALFGVHPGFAVGIADGMCNFVVDQLDEGTPPGTLVFQTSGDVEVATLTFSNPAFGASSGGTATAGAITADSSATGGTIAKARWKNQAGTDKIICSVTATGGGGDIQLNSVVVSAGQQVSMSSLTYSGPA
jgi:hypothetical protein